MPSNSGSPQSTISEAVAPSSETAAGTAAVVADEKTAAQAESTAAIAESESAVADGAVAAGTEAAGTVAAGTADGAEVAAGTAGTAETIDGVETIDGMEPSDSVQTTDGAEATSATATNGAESTAATINEAGGPSTPAFIAIALDAVLASAKTPEMFDAPDSIVLDYYGISATDFDDAVFMMSVDSLLADEIVIVCGVDSEAAEKIEQRLQNRLKTKADEARSYSPEQYAIIDKCEVTREGRWVAMLVSPEADKMREAFLAVIK